HIADSMVESRSERIVEDRKEPPFTAFLYCESDFRYLGALQAGVTPSDPGVYDVFVEASV
ncbi:MAG: hypothetical protein Q9174_001262, partial [Haloplaca sp. 1 TL-2023]